MPTDRRPARRAPSARAYHASVAPKEGTTQHTKLAFFFRESIKGERRAKRALAAEGVDDDDALAQRRQRVMHELSNYSLQAQAYERERGLLVRR